ncbi:MAG TPA: helix-turn-helix transcriptional regulator [Actinocrinis sp.]|nr:helix-turn-helix transcriptional regulator [Actinocrinis sp.]
MTEPVAFGARLRRLRLDAGLSLGDFARQVNYDKGYLSKVENGHRTASPYLARRCDAVLDADGELAALVREQPRQSRAGNAASTKPPATTDLDAAGWLQHLTERREAIKTVAGSALALGLGLDTALAGGNAPGSSQGSPPQPPFPQGGAPLAVLGDLFTHMRKLGQVTSAQVVLPMLVAQANTLLRYTSSASPRERDDLLILTARYAEYTGWMAQEAGHDLDALAWTKCAVDLATTAGDKRLVAYGLIRQALVTMYRSDSASTIALAQQARLRTTSFDIQAQAARREAQGHALAGDYGACMACLDQARDLQLRARAESSSADHALGPTHLSDPVEMITGWCLYDLGRPRAAAEVLDQQIAAMDPDASRSQSRYGIRRALAYAGAGEIDHACELAGELLDTVDGVSSATVGIELHQLSRALTRFRNNSSVRRLSPRLTASLHVSHF